MNSPSSSRKIAPGPSGHPIVGSLNEFREDRLRFLLSVRQEYGDVVRLQFALIEARLALATMAQRYRLQLVPGHPVEPDPLVTLRPREGVRATLRPYQPAAPAPAAAAPPATVPGPASAPGSTAIVPGAQTATPGSTTTTAPGAPAAPPQPATG
jgi:hypothetical protein